MERILVLRLGHRMVEVGQHSGGAYLHVIDPGQSHCLESTPHHRSPEAEVALALARRLVARDEALRRLLDELAALSPAAKREVYADRPQLQRTVHDAAFVRQRDSL